MPSATLINGTQWDSTYKTLWYFIFRLVGRDFTVMLYEHEQKPGESNYAIVKKFNHASACTNEVKPNRYLGRRVENCFLDEDGKKANPKTSINDNTPGELEQRIMNQLDLATDYLRGIHRK